MPAASGWVYVLVNSAMPGLCKIGYTAGEVAERARQLQTTGVPTPFIVAYKRLFRDCRQAKEGLHRLLERRGFREAANREYFRMEAYEAIDLILSIPDHEALPAASFDAGESDEEYADPGSALFEEAMEYLNGYGQCLQDPAQARSLLEDATRLGFVPAYRELGTLYYFAEGGPRDWKRGVECWKTAVKRGDFYCWFLLARHYWSLYRYEHLGVTEDCGAMEYGNDDVSFTGLSKSDITGARENAVKCIELFVSEYWRIQEAPDLPHENIMSCVLLLLLDWDLASWGPQATVAVQKFGPLLLDYHVSLDDWRRDLVKVKLRSLKLPEHRQ